MTTTPNAKRIKSIVLRVLILLFRMPVCCVDGVPEVCEELFERSTGKAFISLIPPVALILTLTNLWTIMMRKNGVRARTKMTVHP